MGGGVAGWRGGGAAGRPGGRGVGRCQRCTVPDFAACDSSTDIADCAKRAIMPGTGDQLPHLVSPSTSLAVPANGRILSVILTEALVFDACSLMPAD